MWNSGLLVVLAILERFEQTASQQESFQQSASGSQSEPQQLEQDPSKNGLGYPQRPYCSCACTNCIPSPYCMPPYNQNYPRPPSPHGLIPGGPYPGPSGYPDVPGFYPPQPGPHFPPSIYPAQLAQDNGIPSFPGFPGLHNLFPQPPSGPTECPFKKKNKGGSGNGDMLIVQPDQQYLPQPQHPIAGGGVAFGKSEAAAASGEATKAKERRLRSDGQVCVLSPGQEICNYDRARRKKRRAPSA